MSVKFVDKQCEMVVFGSAHWHITISEQLQYNQMRYLKALGARACHFQADWSINLGIDQPEQSDIASHHQEGR